jgi:Leucine-rich repeat (LRR) protein
LSLNLDRNGMNEIPPFGPLEYLQDFSASGNQLVEVTNVNIQPALARLNLSKNKLASLAGISGLENLLFADLSGNKAKTTAGVENLPSLRELVLDENKVATVEGMENMGSLTRLSLRANRVERFDLAPQSLPALAEIDLRDNLTIEDSRVLAGLASCDKLRRILLSGTPLADRAEYRAEVVLVLNQIESIDGEPVTEEEREAAVELKAVRAAEEAAAEEARRGEEEARELAGAQGEASHSDEEQPPEDQEEEQGDEEEEEEEGEED